MPKNAKLIIFLLVVIVAASVFMTLSTSTQKTALEQEKARLENEIAQYKDREQQLTQENKRIGDQLKEAQGAQGRLQKQITDFSDKVTALTTERDDWKTRVEDLKKERDQLIAKLQEKPEVPAGAAALGPGQVMPAGPQDMPTAAAAVPSGDEDQYWAQVLKEKAGLEIKLNELQSKLSQGSVDVEELKKKNSDLEIELGQLKNEKEDIERHIKYSEDLANTLSIDLAREKNDKRYLTDRTDKMKEENLALRAQVKELTASKMALEKSIARISEDKSSAESKLRTTESIIQNRIDEVLDIKKNLDKKIETSSATGSKEIELPPIVISAPSPTSTKSSAANPVNLGSAGYNGRVLSINNDSNFVIIDLGQDAGVSVGDNLSVYRGSKYIAGLEIIQARKDISAADIKQKGAKIQVGDTVK